MYISCIKYSFVFVKGKYSLMNQTGKTTPIRRAAVRETGASRHQGGPTEVPLPETPRTTSQHSTALRGALNWSPITQSFPVYYDEANKAE